MSNLGGGVNDQEGFRRTASIVRWNTSRGGRRGASTNQPCSNFTSLIGRGSFHCVMNDICLEKRLSDDVESQLLIERESIFLSFDKEAKTIRATVQSFSHPLLHTPPPPSLTP